MNTRLKIGISLTLTGGVLIFIASIWMLLYPPNFFGLQMTVSSGFDYLVYLLWLYYSSFSQMITQWLLVGYFGLIVSVIICVLTLAIVAGKLLNYINTIGILLVVLGTVEFLIVIFVGYFLYGNIGSTHFQQMTLIFIFLGVVGGVLTYYGGSLFRFGRRSEKFAEEAKWRKLNKWDV